MCVLYNMVDVNGTERQTEGQTDGMILNISKNNTSKNVLNLTHSQ